jgi:hypothetical protein
MFLVTLRKTEMFMQFYFYGSYYINDMNFTKVILILVHH